MTTRARRAKIACSVDARLLARVERIRATTGESRSAVIGRALAMLTADELSRRKAQRYLQAYRDVPEGPDALAASRRLARRALATLAWDDPS